MAAGEVQADLDLGSHGSDRKMLRVTTRELAAVNDCTGAVDVLCALPRPAARFNEALTDRDWVAIRSKWTRHAHFGFGRS